MVERRPTEVVPGPRVRLALAAIVFDFVNPRGLPNKLLLGLAAPALPRGISRNQVHFSVSLVVRTVTKIRTGTLLLQITISLALTATTAVPK